jgi:hypothetical protein
MKRQRPGGNGNTERKIHVREMADGRAVFYPDSLLELSDQYSIHLHRCFEQWLEQNPDVRVRATLPIVNAGQTVILHVWFERE